MCGRYVVSSPIDVLRRRFRFEGMGGPLPARFNVSPRQAAPVVLSEEARRLARPMEWGLLPSWVKDVSKAIRPINARAETVAEKPSYREALKSRRALVPADGFYEWRKAAAGRGKEPVLFRLAGGEPFAFAGLFESWAGAEGSVRETFTIVTTEANPLVAKVHPRMPVILPPEAEEQWLDPGRKETAALLGLLVPFPESRMEAFFVSTRVNSPANEGPGLLEGMRPLD
jgi:putative SOS response-associated peptidase YedK